MSDISSAFLIRKTRPTEDFTVNQNRYLDILERTIEQLVTRAGPTDTTDDPFTFSPNFGVGSDSISAGITTSEATASNAGAILFEELDSIMESAVPVVEMTGIFNQATVTQNYTAQPFDFVNAKNNVTVTFPEFPDSNSVIIIRNGDGSRIRLDGNGRNINGESVGYLYRKTTSISKMMNSMATM